MPPKKAARYTDVTTGKTVEVKPVTKRPEPPEMPQGYTHIRNGIFEHTAMNRMSPSDYCVFTTLLRFADFKTGVCVSNANSIAVHWGGNMSPASVRQCLNRLREAKYIVYPYRNGERGSYPILIDKYEPGGELLGFRLHAAATFNLNDPVYEWVSPTPMTDVYSEEELTTLKDSMQEVWDWVKDTTANADATAPEGTKWLEHGSYSGQKQVGCGSYAGRSQSAFSLEAGRMQSIFRRDALYTASLLHGITKSRLHGGTASPPTTGGGGRASNQTEEIEFLHDKGTSTFNIEEEDDDLV